jgi:hypothetical protein
MTNEREDGGIVPNVSYVYNTTTSPSSGGGPIFILLYIQCGIFIINQYLHLSMELWQLIFPTFIAVMSLSIGLMNQRS